MDPTRQGFIHDWLINTAGSIGIKAKIFVDTYIYIYILIFLLMLIAASGDLAVGNSDCVSNYGTCRLVRNNLRERGLKKKHYFLQHRTTNQTNLIALLERLDVNPLQIINTEHNAKTTAIIQKNTIEILCTPLSKDNHYNNTIAMVDNRMYDTKKNLRKYSQDVYRPQRAF
jgi:hypothetical protein